MSAVQLSAAKQKHHLEQKYISQTLCLKLTPSTRVANVILKRKGARRAAGREGLPPSGPGQLHVRLAHCLEAGRLFHPGLLLEQMKTQRGLGAFWVLSRVQ